ncbi:MAG: 50S ribosomal protein L11 methyltransferase, partial [Chloroflexota bacterium]
MENEKEGQAWMEVSLLVNGELAEPVASLLSEHLSEGVVIEQVGEGAMAGIPGLSGMVKVYGYIPRDARLPEREEEIKRALWHLSQIEDLPEPAFRPLKVEDWRTAWQKNYRPIPIGTRLVVVP